MSKDSQTPALAEIMQLVDRQVWILTAQAGERRGGLVATWVSFVSIDPATPVLLISIATNHSTAELIGGSGAFAAHLVTSDQLDLVWNFALGSSRDRDKLAGVATEQGATGSPILVRCLAWLDCRVFFRLDTGDRIYFWADVLASDRRDQGRPLLQSELMAAASPEQRRQLEQDRHQDLRIQQPRYRQWRASLEEGGGV